MSISVPYEVIGSHLLAIPAMLNGTRPARMLFDTGSGITVVDAAVLRSLGAEPTGRSYTGRRMSGQAITVPLFELPSVAVGELRHERAEVGGLDLSAFGTAGASLDGIVSLSFFREHPVTVDPGRRRIELPGRTGDPIEEVPVGVEIDGPSTEMFLETILPGGRSAWLEVDTGSNSLILDERYMFELGIAPDPKRIERRDGTDETGHPYTRWIARLPGAIAPRGAPACRQDEPPVVFQRIIYDGLIGYDFLRRFVTTFDVAGSRIRLCPVA